LLLEGISQFNDYSSNQNCHLEACSPVLQIARKPWIIQEMISKMDERRRWKNVNTEEGRNH
jgi:hypothetical protein